MNIRTRLAMMATEGLVSKWLPAGVRNRAFRLLMRELVKEASKDVCSQEIYDTPPFPCDPGSHLKVVTLVSDDDVEILLWSLKSLFLYSGKRWDLCIVDGGIRRSQRTLRAHFPGLQMFLEPELTAATLELVKEFPETMAFRANKGYVPAKKIIDIPWILRRSKFLLMDSDILFFQKPDDLLSRLEDESYNRYSFSTDSLGINSGLAIIPCHDISFSRVEAALCGMSSERRHTWQVEQNLFSDLAKDEFDLLPPSYAIEPITQSYEELVCCHFVHVCRDRFFRNGIMQLRRAGFVKQLHDPLAI